MLFKIVLGNLEQKIFFGTQPWWTTFKLSSMVIFVKKAHKTFLKSYINPCKSGYFGSFQPVFAQARIFSKNLTSSVLSTYGLSIPCYIYI